MSAGRASGGGGELLQLARNAGGLPCCCEIVRLVERAGGIGGKSGTGRGRERFAIFHSQASMAAAAGGGADSGDALASSSSHKTPNREKKQMDGRSGLSRGQELCSHTAQVENGGE